nr:hypothetical protein [Brevundimonas diminuta]
MALPTSGSISIDDIKAELGITGELSLNDSRVMALAGLSSGSITLPNDLWGKSSYTIDFADIPRFFTSATNGNSSTANWREGAARTSPAAAILFISFTAEGTATAEVAIYRNTNAYQRIGTAWLNEPNVTYVNQTIAVTAGDTLRFRVVIAGEGATQNNPFTDHQRSGTVTIRLNNASGPVVDTFTFNGSFSDSWSGRPGGPGGGPIEVS